MTDPHTRDARALCPPDLGASEADLAAWFKPLGRPSAPALLRSRLLAGIRADQPLEIRRPGGRLLRAFPLGAWGLATAALLLLAIGTVVSVELRGNEPARTTDTVFDPASRLVIIEDPTLAVFHNIETFDEVGLAPDQLIADWHR